MDFRASAHTSTAPEQSPFHFSFKAFPFKDVFIFDTQEMASVAAYIRDLVKNFAENKLFLVLTVLYFGFKFYKNRQAQQVAAIPIEGSKVQSIHSVAEWDKLMASAKETNAVVVVDFFATWCPPCVAATPTYAKMSKGTQCNVLLTLRI
jgi:thiol:disulfide interchange protein